MRGPGPTGFGGPGPRGRFRSAEYAAVMIAVPEDFARATVAREAARGRDWIAGLPALVDALLQRWDCVPTAAATHGQVGLVLPVRDGEDRAAVLKVSYPHPGNAAEPDAFTAWDGRGAVRLYARDDERFAMLLERAEPRSLADVDDVDEAVEQAGRLARRPAVPAPPELPRLRDLAVRWAAGLRADPAYDAVTMLRSRYEDLLTAPDLRAALLRRLAVFCDAAGIDRERGRRWAQFRTVTAAVRGRRHGDPAWVIEATDVLADLLV
jgi:streptomycin 6-kinase